MTVLDEPLPGLETPPDPEPTVEPHPSGRVQDAVALPREPGGLCIRRIRLGSVMKLASVFFLLGYATTMGTLVVLWNVAERLGFVADLEELVETSLGLEAFDVVGRELFDVAVVGVGVVFAIGFVITLLLALVYNAACTLFGGLAVETGPLRRPRKVLALRHRRFIDVR